jgi:4a-hydroxytetrahydrobiopterin dehydratase
MDEPTRDELLRKSCRPCEGGVPPLGRDQAVALLAGVPDWHLSEDGTRIRRRWVARDFASGIAFLQKVAELAEQEGHHPDLHLEGYRNVAVDLWTHAIGGLSENDFILAAKIDALPIALRKRPTP